MLTDYALGPLIAAAPDLVGFQNDETMATLLCRTLGGGILAATSITRAEGALVPLLPFKLHLAGDVVGGLLAMSAPWLFGFAHNAKARNTFLAIGAATFLAGNLTQSQEML